MIGATASARSICRASKFKTQMYRIFPSASSCAIAPAASSMDPSDKLSGFPCHTKQWILIQIDRVDVGPARGSPASFFSNRSRLQVVRDLARHIPHQAAFRKLIKVAGAGSENRSAPPPFPNAPNPYAAAVSIQFIPRFSAARITAIDAVGSFGPIRFPLPRTDRPGADTPIGVISKSPLFQVFVMSFDQPQVEASSGQATKCSSWAGQKQAL